MGRLAAVCLVAVCVCSVACGAGEEASSSPAPDPSPTPAAVSPAALDLPAPEPVSGAVARGGDLILVTIDTLRADAVGYADWYGDDASRAATPLLDRLAAEGRSFPFAHAHNVVTLPSHTNILSGRYPYEHGVRDNAGFTVPDDLPTLATVLAQSGYATAAVVAAYPLDSSYGLDRGFDLYDDAFPRGGGGLAGFVVPQRPGTEVVARALDWWEAQDDDTPRFLWVHLFDPHAPYEPPEPFASRYPGDPYLGEVAAVDAALAPLLEPLLDAAAEGGKEGRPALVAFTSDHGEALGEHGEATHGLFAYEGTLAVPLVLWGTGIPPAVDPRPAYHVDLAPTLLGALGVAAPEGLPGISLLDPPEDSAGRDGYFESLSTHLNRGWAPLRGLLAGGDKVIDLPIPELYDLGQDPGEEANLVDDRRRRFRELRSRVPEAAYETGAREATSPEQAAQLRSLGYLTGSAATKDSYGPEDDPKTLVEVDQKLQRVVELYSAGRLDEAIALGRAVVAERPDLPLGYSYLAQALLEAGRPGEALDVMARARAEEATSPSLMRQMALTLSQTGRPGEAVELLESLAEHATAGDVQPTLVALGLALSDTGEQARAREVLTRAATNQPGDAQAHENLGLVALRSERHGEARRHLERALELDPRRPEAWNMLAVARLQGSGDARGAIEAWERALNLDPQNWDALLNLGRVAAQAGDAPRARHALGRFVAEAPAGYGREKAAAREMLGRLP